MARKSDKKEINILGIETSCDETAAQVMRRHADGTVESSVKISDGENGGPSLESNDNFGSAVASLGDLNERLGQRLPMLRFRPNLVVAGCPPYAEDGWRRIRIGRVGFRIVKPCSRCAITTVDPESAMKGAEPLKTLSRYRRSGQAVYFGQNAIQDGPGVLRVGDAVEVSER